MFRHSSFIIRHSALLLLALIPLITLFHKSDLNRWDTNRSLMTAPDEFSYILTAQNILQGNGISTKTTLGLDTFYPPGYPLLLASWSLLTGTLTPFSAHLLNALLLSAATLIVYLFTKRLLNLLNETPAAPHHPVPLSPSHLATIPLLIAALFATNWTVLESALYVFSEPAFMLITFAWLALTLKWKHWHLHPLQTLPVALLAIAAWSLRGAGIVCIAVTIAYPCLSILKSKIENRKSKIISLTLILLLALAYQLALLHFSPEKSLFHTNPSSNSYPRQLLGGITQRGAFHLSHPTDWPQITARLANLAASHLNDFAESLTPWLRDSPDYLPRYLLGKILALLALAGFLRNLFQSKMGGGENRKSKIPLLLNLYLLFYFLLYLLWPFNMPRFWSPILPIMLLFALDALRHFFLPRPVFTAQRAAVALFALLLILNAEELFLHLGAYQRRINDVSDALAAAAATVVQHSPDPLKTKTIVAGDDEHLVFTWYFHLLPAGKNFLPLSPVPPPSDPNAPCESLTSLLDRQLRQLSNNPSQKLYIISYFTEPDYPQIFEKLNTSNPLFGQFHAHKIFQRDRVTTVWELRIIPKS